MKMKKEIKIIISGIIIILLVGDIVFLISAAINLSDPLAQQRHKKILDEFDKGNEWVNVIIGINSIDVKEIIISSLSDKEFILDKGPSTPKSIFGKVTRNGLDKLSNNPSVTSINLREVISTQENNSINNTTLIENLNNKTKPKYLWVYLIIAIMIFLIIIAIIIKRNK